MITGGLVADGHDLHVDDTTVRQLFDLAVKRGKVPVTLEHTGGIKDVNGYLYNFSIQGKKLRADWQLLEHHDETPVMLERAEKQPETFGLSVAFKGQGIMFQGKKCARAEKLLSADCVKRPAAAPDGLFSAKETQKVDIIQKSMADENNQQQQPTLSDVMNLLQSINQRLDAHEEVQNQLVEHINQSVVGEQLSDVELLEALYNMTPEELDAFNAEHGTNFTPELINAEVEAYNAEIDSQGGDEDGGEGEYAGAGSEAGATALNAIAREVIELKAKAHRDEVRARTEAENIEFAELQENIAALIEQRDRLVEFSERMVAENEALRLAAVRGGKPAGVSAEFEFKERSEGGSVIEFETIVNEEYNRLIKSGVSEAKAKSKAIDFGVKRHPISYQLWRERGAKELNFSAKD